MLFEEIKQKYISTFAQKQKDLQMAWENKDMVTLHALLHKLTGSSGSYGFDQLSLLSRQGMNLTGGNKIVDLQQLEKCYKEIYSILQSQK